MQNRYDLDDLANDFRQSGIAWAAIAANVVAWGMVAYQVLNF